MGNQNNNFIKSQNVKNLNSNTESTKPTFNDSLGNEIIFENQKNGIFSPEKKKKKNI